MREAAANPDPVYERIHFLSVQLSKLEARFHEQSTFSYSCCIASRVSPNDLLADVLRVRPPVRPSRLPDLRL